MKRLDYLEGKYKQKLPLSREEIEEMDDLQWPEILAFANSNRIRYRDWKKTLIWVPSEKNGKVSFKNFL